MSTPGKPSPKLDPAIQDIFDAMAAYMGTTYNSSTASMVIDAVSTAQTFTCTDRLGNRQSYTTYAVGNKVTILPSSAALLAGQTQQFTASVTDPTGNPISGAVFVWSMSTGALGTVDANGLYTAPATLSAASTEQLTAQVQNAFSAATVNISLQTNIGMTGR